jgi:N-acetylmuramoyl-L-alanine amidase
MTAIVISSGHGKYIRGASGYLDEVDEARRVVPQVAEYLRQMGCTVHEFHDDVSTTQNENLQRIVAFHDSKQRDLDVSVHFNAYQTTQKPMGCEVLYVTQKDLAAKMSAEMAAEADWPNRGAKKRTDLYFLNNTDEPAVLIEVCFVDSKSDEEQYRQHFDGVCRAIAESITGLTIEGQPPEQPPEHPPDIYPTLELQGKVSWFGGPEDDGVSPSEGLAFIYNYEEAPYLFLPYQPEGTSGLARRLDPSVFYLATRWDYSKYPKEMLASGKYKARVTNPDTGKSHLAFPADWGPNEATDRVCDVSQGLLDALGLDTDDEVDVMFPADASMPPRPDEPEVPTVTVSLESDSPARVRVVVGPGVEIVQ